MPSGNEKPEPPTDITTELGKERTHTAYENNLMSWIRTSLSLVGFGIGVFEVAQRTSGETIFKSSKLIGLFLIVLGIAAVFMAINENKKNHALLLNTSIKYQRRTSLGLKVGYVLIIISVLALINIIYRISNQGI